MRKINKIVNMALIFMLVGVVVCQEVTYPSHLRVPVGIDKEKTKEITKHLKQKDDKYYNNFFERNYLMLDKILLKIIRESDRKPSTYKDITFELTALMLMLKKPMAFAQALVGFTHNIHHYEDYKIAMSIIGMAIVIASRFNPIIIEFSEPRASIMAWNDEHRNFNRLIGFFREEQRALAFLEILEGEASNEKKPWYIDSQISILDTLEAIDYKSKETLSEVIKRLQKLTDNTSISKIVQNRLREVINVLKTDGRKSSYKEIHERLIAEFEIYKDKVVLEDTRLVKAMEDVESNVVKDKFGDFDLVGLYKYFGDLGDRSDPVDIYKIQIALEQVRIDYDEAIQPLASGQGVEPVFPIDGTELPNFKGFVFKKGTTYGSKWDYEGETLYEDGNYPPGLPIPLFHTGLDIREYQAMRGMFPIEEGTPIKAAVSGKVIIGKGAYDYNVIIKSPKGRLFLHNHILALVEPGTEVKAGDIIGKFRAFKFPLPYKDPTPHLHLEVLEGDFDFPVEIGDSKEKHIELLLYIQTLRSTHSIDPFSIWPDLLKNSEIREDDTRLSLESLKEIQTQL